MMRWPIRGRRARRQSQQRSWSSPQASKPNPPHQPGAGARRVFVTERDSLTGPYASEGVLQSTDPLTANPVYALRSSFYAVRTLAHGEVSRSDESMRHEGPSSLARLITPAPRGGCLTRCGLRREQPSGIDRGGCGGEHSRDRRACAQTAPSQVGRSSMARESRALAARAEREEGAAGLVVPDRHARAHAGLGTSGRCSAAGPPQLRNRSPAP
jgi:hypothetical protein